MSIRIGVVLLMLALTACKGTGEPPPDGPPDSGVGTPDSGTPDSGTPDSGTPDSGTPDSGTPDSGTPDSGTPTGCFYVPAESLEWGTEGFQYGTEKSDEFLDVAINSQGMLYLSGYENGDVGKARFDPSGDSKGLLLRVGKAVDSEVSVQYWERKFDVPGTTETVDALAFHPVTGALYFTGRTTGAFNRTNGASADFTNMGQQDVFVGGPKGTERDVVLYQGGTLRPQHPNRLAFDAQGALIVSGFDDFYVPAGTNYVERWEDPFIIKLERSADELTLQQTWWRSFDTTYVDTLGGLAVDIQRDSSIYVTGNNGGGSQRGAFVRKIDNSTGEPDLSYWRQSPISLDTIQAAQFLENGDLLLAGATFGLMGSQSYGEQDVVLRLLNMNPLHPSKAVGEALWTEQYGSPGSDYVTDMTVDAKGNIIVVGETLDSVIENDPSAYKGSYDIFMMKFDKNGRRIDVKQWGSAAEDHPNAVAVDACGEIFIVGYTTGDLLPPYAAVGERDAFVITTARPNGSSSGGGGDDDVSTQVKP